ncbi:MAG: hypothetical protein AAFV43_14285 [Planctomycetota bacterium]
MPLSVVEWSAADLIGEPRWDQPTVSGTPAGFVVNRLEIDFDSPIGGQLLYVELDNGSIFQSEIDSLTPPPDALIPIFPEVAADSFVTMGGPTASSTGPVFVVGSAVDIPEALAAANSTAARFDTTGANITWSVVPGANIRDRQDFTVAQLTLSDDASGRVGFLPSFLGNLSDPIFYWEFDNGSDFARVDSISPPTDPGGPIDPGGSGGTEGVTAVTADRFSRVIDNENFIVNDIFVDHEGRLGLQQILLSLTKGEVYQGPVDQDTAPLEALVGVAPNQEFDSFVTMGGPTAETSRNVLAFGGAVDLGGDPVASFDSQSVNIAWSASIGELPVDSMAFQIARLTLSDDAEGTIQFLSSTIEEFNGTVRSASIVNGQILLPEFIPEPAASLAAMLAAALACVADRRGRS